MQMAAVGDGDPAAREFAADDRRGRIGEGEHEQRQRRSDGERRSFERSVRRQCRDGETDEHTAAIAEVDRRRGKIEPQKADEPPGHRDGDESFERVTVIEGHRGERHADHRPDRTEHPVHTVEQIQGVDGRKKPEERHRDRERAQLHGPPEQRHAGDEKIAAENEYGDREALAG